MSELIYRVVHQVDEYQYFLPEDPDQHTQFLAACTPLKAVWTSPSVFIYEPFHKRGDFFQPNQSCLVLGPRALALLEDYLTTMGEILYLSYRDETYGFFNCLDCYDCLDVENSTWLPGFEKILVQDHVFRKDRLPLTGLFKIPQTHVSEVLLYTNSVEKVGFKQLVEAHHLQGLRFELVWQAE